jgi:carbonic anhydrase
MYTPSAVSILGMDICAIQKFLFHLFSVSGPATWAKNFEAAKGENQSPIDIVTSDVIEDPSMPPLEITYKPEESVKIDNNGHTFVVNIKEEDSTLNILFFFFDC